MARIEFHRLPAMPPLRHLALRWTGEARRALLHAVAAGNQRAARRDALRAYRRLFALWLILDVARRFQRYRVYAVGRTFRNQRDSWEWIFLEVHFAPVASRLAGRLLLISSCFVLCNH